MYTLNFLFNFNDTDGRFTGDKGGGALRKSRNWLRLNLAERANPNPPTFDPEVPGIWTDLGEADTLLLPSVPDPGNICLRIAVDPTAAPFPGFDSSTATLRLIVAFGTPPRARQTFASPFTTDGTPGGPTNSTFVFGPIARNTAVAWFFPVGRIVKRPNNPNLTHRYEFTVGVIVTTPAGVTRTYGDDPEMDVGA